MKLLQIGQRVRVDNTNRFVGTISGHAVQDGHLKYLVTLDRGGWLGGIAPSEDQSSMYISTVVVDASNLSAESCLIR